MASPYHSKSKRRKHTEPEEDEELDVEAADESLENSLDSCSRLVSDDDSDSQGMETVEVEEVDVTEEYIVSIDDELAEELIVEEEVETEPLFDPLLEVSTVTYGSSFTSSCTDVVTEEITTSSDVIPDKLQQGPAFVFKAPNFVHSSSKGPGSNKRTRVWKNLKQITTAERSFFKEADTVTYGSIDSPPSFKPAKKYSDISGLEARYTDPQTKMRYSNADEFQRVRLLPMDIISGCLALRKANVMVH